MIHDYCDSAVVGTIIVLGVYCVGAVAVCIIERIWRRK
jgi:hypothetical protein